MPACPLNPFSDNGPERVWPISASKLRQITETPNIGANASSDTGGVGFRPGKDPEARGFCQVLNPEPKYLLAERPIESGRNL